MDSTRVIIDNTSLEKIANHITKPVINNESVWDTMIPLLVGALITISVQLILSYITSSKEKSKRQEYLVSASKAKIYLISQILKDLAMYKVHKQYYLRAYQIDKSDEDAFNKHYEKGQEARSTKAKLDVVITEFLEMISEALDSKKKLKESESNFNKVFDYEHPKSSNFKEINSGELLPDALKKEEQRLNKEYEKFKELFDNLHSLISS